MRGVKKLARSNVPGRWTFHARETQISAPPLSQCSRSLHGWQRSLVNGQETWKMSGTMCAVAVCPNDLLARGPSWVQSSLCPSSGIAYMRGLASQSSYNDQEDSELELIDVSMSGSDLEVDPSNSSSSDSESSETSSTTENRAGKISSKQDQQGRKNAFSSDSEVSDEEHRHGKVSNKQQQQRKGKNVSLGDSHPADEEDFEPDELRVNSPLDAASETLIEGMNTPSRPLWKRLEEASEKTKHFLLKDVFDEWTSEGNTLSRAEIIYTITILRKRRKYWRAMEVSDWLMREKPFELNDMDFGVRVELISKLQGVSKAADYFAMIPKVFQTSMVYSILLSAYVEQNKEKEAIALLKKVEKLGLSHRTYMYNQLLHLYKKNGIVAGVAEVLKTMEEKHVEPDIFTYNMILDVRSRKADVSGMEFVLNHIKEDKNVEPDASTYAVLAKGYITAGMLDKARKAVEKIEQSPFRTRRYVNLVLLKLYGNLGMEDQLERVWGIVTEGPRIGHSDYMTMIRSLGKVGNSCRAEDLFEEMEEKIGLVTVHHYNALLSVYASLGRTQKGETLLKLMARAKLHPNNATHHELVCMYLNAGQEHKAMEVLSVAQKASRTSTKMRPMYITYQTILDHYAQKGDVKNAEKLVKDMKFAGYTCAFRSYMALLKAYENGATSPYGFLDRLKADNVVPNQQMRKQVRMLDGT